MNIFVLRNKLKSLETTTVPDEATIPQILPPPPAPPAAPPRPKKSSIEQALPQTIGLNDLFELTDKQLNKLSPTGNFSKLRTIHSTPAASEQTKADMPIQNETSSQATMTLNAILTIDSSEVERWLNAR